MRAYFRILTQFTLSLMVVIPLGMLLFPSITGPTQSKSDPCAENLKQVALGIFMYTQDYDEKFPRVTVNEKGVSASNPWGWADAVTPYLKSTTYLHCPLNPQYKNKRRPNSPKSWGYTDYFFNRRLSGVSQAEVEAVALTVMLGDGNDGTGGTSARYSLSALPPKWRTDKKSPSHRHNGGAYYSFADGHVMWFKPGVINTDPVRYEHVTFAVTY